MAATFSLQHAAALPAPLPASSRPVLYTHTLCPYAQRVLLTMLLKVCTPPFCCSPLTTSPAERLLLAQDPLQPFDVVHVDLSNKPRWYSKVNPRGLVPAITIGGRTLVESLDICRCGRPARPISGGRGERGCVQTLQSSETGGAVTICCCRELDQVVPSPPLTPAAPAARRHMETLLEQTSSIVSAGVCRAHSAGMQHSQHLLWQPTTRC